MGKTFVILKLNFPSQSHQVSELQNEGRECILITSGAVAFGKQKLAQEVMMSMSMRETIQQNNTKEEIASLMAKSLKKPNAAVGQSGLQALYETMFRNYGILVGQVGVTRWEWKCWRGCVYPKASSAHSPEKSTNGSILIPLLR